MDSKHTSNERHGDGYPHGGILSGLFGTGRELRIQRDCGTLVRHCSVARRSRRGL